MKALNNLKSMLSIIALCSCMGVTYGQPLAFVADTDPLHQPTENKGIKPYSTLHAEFKSLEEKERIQLWVYNQEERKLNISLSSETQVLWFMKTREAYISRILNLASLEDGIYYIEIGNGKTKISRKLVLQSKIKTEKNIQIH